nr:protein RKD1-like [Ipomoea batatas]
MMPKKEYGVDFESFTQIDCPPLLDYDYFSGYSEYSLWDYHCGFSMQESPFEASPAAASAMEAFVNEAPLYPSMDIEQSSHNIVQDCNSLWGFGNGLGELNGAISEEFGIGANDVEAENHTLVSNGGSDNMEISNGSVEDNKKGKKSGSGSGVEEKCCISKTLSRETVSNYFYMPISQAAKELNIGLTLLKKRCRELGIRRWPHRKLMSLESLIKNVQELGKNQGEGKIREAIKVLENERKLLLRTPDLQLDETTKRLRQACFKANYKKRRLVGMASLRAYQSEPGIGWVDPPAKWTEIDPPAKWMDGDPPAKWTEIDPKR